MASFEEAAKGVRTGKEVWIITRTLVDEHTSLAEFLGADDYEIIEPEVPEKEEPAPTEEEPPKKKKFPAPVDHGKIIALYKAGWAPLAIADEMRCSLQTVTNHIKKEGL